MSDFKTTETIPTSTRTVVVRDYVRNGDLSNLPLSSIFEVKDVPLPEALPEDGVLVRTLYISNDFALVGLIQNFIDVSSRADIRNLIPLGAPMQAFSVSCVIKVGAEVAKEGIIKVGDLVEGRTPWASYAIVNKEQVKVIKQLPGVSPSHYLGIMGSTGQLVYWAFEGILKPRASDTLVVSVAAGSIGSIAVQYAKRVLGVKRVVGIAGTDEKCAWIKDVLGADEAVNYKSPTFVEDLEKATPDKVDRFLDIAGGKILDDVMLRMNTHGIICACGAVSVMDNLPNQSLPKHFLHFMMQRLTIQAYTPMDYADRFGESSNALIDAVTSGKYQLDGVETIVDVGDRVEEIPAIWARLYSGGNKGKLITKLGE